jgi:hypothetical protein
MLRKTFRILKDLYIIAMVSLDYMVVRLGIGVHSYRIFGVLMTIVLSYLVLTHFLK